MVKAAVLQAGVSLNLPEENLLHPVHQQVAEKLRHKNHPAVLHQLKKAAAEKALVVLLHAKAVVENQSTEENEKARQQKNPATIKRSGVIF